MYSPTPMLKAPAMRPATPARTMIPGSGLAPATPMTRARLETSPSLAPKTMGRRTVFALVSWGSDAAGSDRSSTAALRICLRGSWTCPRARSWPVRCYVRCRGGRRPRARSPEIAGSVASLVRHRATLADIDGGARKGQRPGGHPPLEHVVGETPRLEGGIEVARSPGLVEIARQDRETTKRRIRLFPEGAVGKPHAVAAELRPVGKVPCLQGLELSGSYGAEQAV